MAHISMTGMKEPDWKVYVCFAAQGGRIDGCIQTAGLPFQTWPAKHDWLHINAQIYPYANHKNQTYIDKKRKWNKKTESVPNYW